MLDTYAVGQPFCFNDILSIKTALILQLQDIAEEICDGAATSEFFVDVPFDVYLFP